MAPECRLLPTTACLYYGFNVMFSCIVVHVWSRALWSWNCALFKSHSSDGSRRKQTEDSVSCRTVCHIWNVSAQACSTERYRGQKVTMCQFHSLPVRCSSVWTLIPTSFPSYLAVLTEVHMPPSRQPLCLSVVAVGLIRIAAVTSKVFHFFFFRSCT